jgi:hypothetical protein
MNREEALRQARQERIERYRGELRAILTERQALKKEMSREVELAAIEKLKREM